MPSTMNDDLLQRALDGNVEAVKALLDAGADVHHRSWYGDTALHQAAESNHVDGRGRTIRALLEAGSDVNAQNKGGETALLVARGREAIQDLLTGGADVNISDRKGTTALMNAATGTDVELTRLLLEHGAAVNEWNNDGHTALTIAARLGPAEQVQALVGGGADPNVRPAGECNQTALFFAIDQDTSGWVSDQVSADKVHALLKAGARVDHQDDSGYTVLHFTSWGNLPKTAQVLLDHGADTTLVTRQGETAEDMAEGETLSVLIAHRERQALREVSGLTDDQEPVQRARRM